MAATAAGANYALRLVVISSLIGAEEAGRYQLLIAYLSMGSSLADFGLTSAIMPRLARARGVNSPALRASINIRMVSIVAVGLGVGVYLAVSDRVDLIVPFGIAFLGCFVSARLLGVRNTLDLLWRLKGRSWVAGSFAVLDSVIALVAVLIVSAISNVTVTTVAVLWTLSSIPGFLLAVIPLLPELRRSDLLRRPIPRRYYKGVIAASAPVGLTLFLGQVGGQLETLVLNWSGTLADVGHYGVAIAPLTGFLFVPSAIGSGLGPVVSQLVRGSRRDLSLSWFTSIATRLTGLFALGLAAVAMVFADEILGLFPSEYAGGGYIIRLYAIVIALVFLIVVFDGFLIAIENRRRLLIGAFGGLALAVVLEAFLVGPFGVRGMLIGKIAVLVGLLWYQIASFPAEMRAGARSGLWRLALPIAVFVAAYVLADGLSLALHASIVFVATTLSAALVRTITFEEIRRIRTLAIS